MLLLPGERMLMESSGKVLTLTSSRVRYDAKERGSSKVISITLDAVSSCSLATRSYPMLLILCALAGIVGVILASNRNDGSTVFFIAAVVLGVAYLLLRSAILQVSSAGGAIVVPARGMSREALLEFVDAVDEAKLKFLTRPNP